MGVIRCVKHIRACCEKLGMRKMRKLVTLATQLHNRMETTWAKYEPEIPGIPAPWVCIFNRKTQQTMRFGSIVLLSSGSWRGLPIFRYTRNDWINS